MISLQIIRITPAKKSMRRLSAKTLRISTPTSVTRMPSSPCSRQHSMPQPSMAIRRISTIHARKNPCPSTACLPEMTVQAMQIFSPHSVFQRKILTPKYLPRSTSVFWSALTVRQTTSPWPKKIISITLKTTQLTTVRKAPLPLKKIMDVIPLSGHSISRR